MKKSVKSLRKGLFFTLFAFFGAIFFHNLVLNNNAFALTQGALAGGTGHGGSGETWYSGVFWNYLRWTTDKNMTYPTRLQVDPVGGAPYDVGSQIYNDCKDAPGFWILLSNTGKKADGTWGYSGFVKQLYEYDGAYHDRAKNSYSYYGYRLLGDGDSRGYVTIPGYASGGKPGFKSGDQANYDAAYADYYAAWNADPSKPDWWASGELSYFCDVGDKEVELASKSAVKYTASNGANGSDITALDENKTNPAPVSVDADTVTVTFEQYLYSKKHDPSNFPDEATVTYKISSSVSPATTYTLGGDGDYPDTKLNSLSWSQAPDESDYYRAKVTNDDNNKITLNMPTGEGIQLKVCQKIEYKPKKFKISGTIIKNKQGQEDSEICIIFSRGTTTTGSEFKSKSGAGYDGSIMGFTEFDSTGEIPAVSVDSSREEVTVNFAQRLYIFSTASSVSALNSLNPKIETGYTIFSSQGGAPTQSRTAINTSAAGWIASPSDDAGGYKAYYQEFTFEVTNFAVPAGGSARICQGIKYDPKYYSVSTSGEITYNGNGQSEICIEFTRDDPPPTVNYCIGQDGVRRYEANINYGSTYGWSGIYDLTAKAEAWPALNFNLMTVEQDNKNKNTMDTYPDILATDHPNDKDLTVRIYAKPGDTIAFAHALCYGAQAVRSSNNYYVTPGAVNTSKQNLRENRVALRGVIRTVSKTDQIGEEDGNHNPTDSGTATVVSEYGGGKTGDSRYAFNKYDAGTSINSHVGIINAGEQKLAGGFNKQYSASADPALVYMVNIGSGGADDFESKSERNYNLETETTPYNVKGVSNWGFYVESPFFAGNGANDKSSLKCKGVYYEDSFVEGGYQISSAYNTGDCSRFSTNDVGKGIAQQVIYLPVYNWIKEGHFGKEKSDFWCRCNARHYYHEEATETTAGLWGNEEGVGYGIDKGGVYTDLQGYDLVEQVFTTKDKHDRDVAEVGGEGNWARERTNKVNTDGAVGDSSSDREVTRGQDTDGRVKYNNDNTSERNSTLSLGNKAVFAWEDMWALAQKGNKQVGWLWYQCSSAGQCKDTWTENIRVEDEVTKYINSTYLDTKTHSPYARISEWKDGTETSPFTTAQISYRRYCHAGHGGPYIVADGGGPCSYTGTRDSDRDYTTYSCSSGTESTRTDEDGNTHHDCVVTNADGTTTTNEDAASPTTHYAYTCTAYYSTDGSAAGDYTQYDNSTCTYTGFNAEPVHKYRYYNCQDGDNASGYPYQSDYPSFSKFVGTGSQWAESTGHTCYQYRFQCQEIFEYDGFNYNVYPQKPAMQYNGGYVNACRVHRCEDNTKRNKLNITNDDHNDTRACSYCIWYLASQYPLGTQTLGGKTRPNVPGGENLFDDYPIPDETGKKTGGGCQFNVNVRENFSVTRNQAKSNIRNNSAISHQIPDRGDGEPSSPSYYNSNNASGAVNGGTDITKTAEVLIPYNYYIVTGSRINSSDAVYLGEDIQYQMSLDLYGRLNTAVDPNPYATYSLTPEDDPDGVGTKVQAIQFIVSPSEKATFTGEVDGVYDGSTDDICAVFGRTRGENCELINSFSSNRVINKEGKPDGPIHEDTDWQSVTVPDNPSQIEVGSLFCVAVGVYPADSHGTGVPAGADPISMSVDGMSHFDDAKWSISGASCRTVSKKPSFQVWNAGVYTEANIKTSVSDKSVNWELNPDPAPADTYTLFGSWDEYAVTANGTVTNFASGAANGYGTNRKRAEYYANYAVQTISNTSASETSPGGHSGVTGVTPDTMLKRLVGRYSTTDGSKINTSFPRSNPIELSNNSKAYYYEIGGTTLNGMSFSSGTHVVRVNGTMTITGNICNTSGSGGGSSTCTTNPTVNLEGVTDPDLKTIADMTLSNRNKGKISNISDLPQVIIIADNIKISPEVTQIDAWLIAAHISGSSISYGEVNTCTGAVTGAKECNKQLLLNGPVIARSLKLNRTGGAHQGEVKITDNAHLKDYNLADNGSATPAEILNLRADVYLWAYSQLDRFTQAQTTYSRELAPRY